MLLKKSLAAVLPLLCLLLIPSSASACACCVERGFYGIATVKPDKIYLGLLSEMKFDTTSELYMNAAGFDGIRGLDELKKDEEAGKSIDLNVMETLMGKTWRLDVTTGNGRKGTLALPLPAMMVIYKVDQHDNAPGTEVSLYKEFFFKGSVRGGTGIFRSANIKPTAYTLVFQGRGNGCDNSSDFTHWRLELDGPKAEYAFFGKLK